MNNPIPTGVKYSFLDKLVYIIKTSKNIDTKTKTVAFLQSVSAEQINGSEERTVTLKLRDKETRFLGQPYLLNFVLPNFYFHLTAAYAILRHNGLEIGKMDYVGND
ncbi:MAG: DUF1993 family protein [Methylococcales bacterium]|nr:DUF1993 family protein [Methylococcales bacterium]